MLLILVIKVGEVLGPLKKLVKGVDFMKKEFNFFVILLCVILTGCNKYDYDVDTINYELNIDKTFNEKIIFTFKPDAYNIKYDPDFTGIIMEDEILNNDNYAINSNVDSIYNKKIYKSSNKIEAVLNYNYLESDFVYSNFIMNCFENYDLIGYEDSFEVKLSGEFSCLNDKNMTITVTSSHEVEDTNGERDGDKYIWHITQDNYNNVNIYHKILRDYDDMVISVSNNNVNNMFVIIKNVLVSVIIGILLVLLYKFYKKKKQELDV